MTRESLSAYRRRIASVERAIDRGLAEAKAERDAEHARRRAVAAEREHARRRFTRDEIEGAGFVHDGYRWRKVVRVNAKTVTVVSTLLETWTDKLTFDKIHAVQAPLEGTG